MVVLFILKVIGLLLLWALFFSPAHRTDVTPGRLEQRLAVAAAEQEP